MSDSGFKITRRGAEPGKPKMDARALGNEPSDAPQLSKAVGARGAPPAAPHEAAPANGTSEAGSPKAGAKPPSTRLSSDGRPKVNIVCRDNKFGLSRDLQIAAEVLKGAGCEVSVASPDGRPEGAFEMNLFLEILAPQFRSRARLNCIMPNPEWFLPEWRHYLSNLVVLCKTRDAQDLFAKYGCQTEFVGFTSVDRRDPQVPRERAFLHMAGRSVLKGTAVVLEAWRRHPEWPTLYVPQSPSLPSVWTQTSNVVRIVRHVPEAELLELQNRCRFHVCPSEYEGFGHYIMEALSCGAVVLATDAPPMSELVSPEHGLLIPPKTTGRMMEAETKQVSVAGIEGAVQRAIAMSDADMAARGDLARARYEKGRAAFGARFGEVACRLLAALRT